MSNFIYFFLVVIATQLFISCDGKKRYKVNKKKSWVVYKKDTTTFENYPFYKPIIVKKIENNLKNKGHRYIDEDVVTPFLSNIVCKKRTFFQMIGNENDIENFAVGKKYNIRIFEFVQTCENRCETVFLSFVGDRLTDKKIISNYTKTHYIHGEIQQDKTTEKRVVRVLYCDLPYKHEPPVINFLKKHRVEYWAIDSYGKFYLAGHKDNPTEKDWSMFSVIPIYP